MMQPFPPWEPDRNPLVSGGNVSGVLPIRDGWGPWAKCEPFSEALPSECRGAFMATSLAGVIHVFAGTADAIYSLQSDGSWTDVSIAGGYHLPAGESWSFRQFGDTVPAANIGDPVQSFTLASSTDFANLAGSPPQVRYVGLQGDYLLLLGTAANPHRVHRSGVNDATFWTYGQRGSDYQDLPDGGWITGSIGHQGGALIFQERNIRSLIDQPGSSLLFTIELLQRGHGCIAPHSIIPVENTTFYWSEEGPHKFDGAVVTDLGQERVSETIKADMDIDYLEQVQGWADPARSIVMWRYKSLSGPWKELGYSYALDRFFPGSNDLRWLLTAATAGYTMDQLYSVLGYALTDDIPFSLDSRVWAGGRPSLAGFDSDNCLCFFGGPFQEAFVETKDFPLGEGKRFYISGSRPIGNVNSVTGQVGVKETFGDGLTWKTANGQNRTGMVPHRASGRVARLRYTIPEGTPWSNILAAEIPSENLTLAGRA